MKQKDIALILVIVFFSAILSFAVSKFLFTSSKDRQQEVEVVYAISSDFPEPDKRYFNSKSINPTQLIEIGNSSNPDPFRGSGQ